MPKKTLETIVVGGNDYVIQVKGNSKKLHKRCIKIAHRRRASSRVITLDQSRGRKEYRQIRVFNNLSENFSHEGWVGIKSIIEVTCWGIRKKHKYRKVHYYISSLSNYKAAQYAKGIRAHWHIENRLHWVKDAVLGEDASRIKGFELSSTMSIVRTSVINIYRFNGIKSLTRGVEQFANRLHPCLQLINNYHIKKYRSE